MKPDDFDTNLSISELPSILVQLFERAHRPLLPGATQPVRLFVRYLRRKPGRGLAIIYTVDEVQSMGNRATSHKVPGNNPYRSVSLTLDEKALDGAHIRFGAAQAALEVQPSGELCATEIGLSVQAFPADSQLPALVASCDTAPHSPLFQALEYAAQLQSGQPTWQLVSATAVPVRYKPSSRCVLRYHLSLEDSKTLAQRSLTIFGKVYAETEQARTVQALTEQLYHEQLQDGLAAPLLPRPLGMIDALGLAFNEAVQPEDGQERSLRTGTQALLPQIERGRGGEITGVILPAEELQFTARALARLHNSRLSIDERSPRTGVKEAKRVRERATLIASRNPGQAEEVLHLAQKLSARLEALQPDVYRPAHGGFKSSQLLFHSQQVFVVDFDGFCLADPALDVGYFLAYLRPSGLWYRRPGMRQWFSEASKEFMSAYRQEMLKYGNAQAAIDGILERTPLYEAALLYKIATRRVNRLNSTRPGELSAILREVASCLPVK
ncbi:MAG: hypothetical protein NVSMB27_06860 [Ktedonobacteraceae bacterium]